MAVKKVKKQVNPLAIIVFIILALYLLTMIFSVLWLLSTTLKLPKEYEGDFAPDFKPNMIWFPERGFTFDNYIHAYKLFYVPTENGDVGIIKQFGNSILYSVGCAFATTASCLVMGYATARFRYKLSGYIYAFVLVTMALPIVGALPSEIRVAKQLNIFGSFPGIWIMRANFLNTYFLIFFAQFKMIPKDYTEAAKIDGASPLAVMMKIIVPLAATTTSTVFILLFISYWNDYQIPMIYLENHPVAAHGMYNFVHFPINALDKTPYKLAGIVIMALPIIVVYAIFNKKLNVNLSVGGIKG